MQLAENNRALILRLKNPDPVLATIPKSKLLGEEKGISQVIVKWGLEKSQTLNKLNIMNVPSPIRRDYKWPGFHKPMTHQIKTASFLTLNKKAFCFNEQGTGKTASCIWAADYLMNI